MSTMYTNRNSRLHFHCLLISTGLKLTFFEAPSQNVPNEEKIHETCIFIHGFIPLLQMIRFRGMNFKTVYVEKITLRSFEKVVKPAVQVTLVSFCVRILSFKIFPFPRVNLVSSLHH